jgi:hypothetical protein
MCLSYYWMKLISFLQDSSKMGGEKWFDPAFEDFINNEIVRKTSPKQKM